MRTPPSTGHHQEIKLFLSNQFGRGIRFGRVRAHGDYTVYSVLHYIVLFSLAASTTRRKRSVLTLEKKLKIIGGLKKGKSLRCVSGLYDVPKSTVVLHCDIWKDREKIRSI